MPNNAITADAELAALAARVASGDALALEPLFTVLLPRVRNLVRYLVRGDQDVDDLAQQALLNIWKGRSGYRADGAFKSWTDRIVARTVFTALKRRPPPAASLESVDLPGLEPSPDTYTLRRQLVRRLDCLSVEQRQALVLHYVVGWSIDEAAAQCGVSRETLRSRLRLGKKRLQAAVRDSAGDLFDTLAEPAEAQT